MFAVAQSLSARPDIIGTETAKVVFNCESSYLVFILKAGFNMMGKNHISDRLVFFHEFMEE